MYLKAVELSNFRNFLNGQFEFCPGLNLFFGPNASGKTNLLEAIHVLSNLRSFRTRSFRELTHWEKKESYVRGVIQPGSQIHQDSFGIKTLAVGVKTNSRIPLINSKPCKTSKTYLQVLPSATFVPDDLSLVKGAPALRRYFLDKGTFHFYPPYWALLTDFNRVLRQKNVLLREWQRKGGTSASKESCDVWNLQLQTLGSKIIIQRLLFIQSLQRLLQDVYAKWLGTEETIDIRYRTSLGLTEEEVQRIAPLFGDSQKEEERQYILDIYGKAIQRHVDREYRLGTTIIGPHRDDLDIRLAGRPLRAYGSQGQQRSAVLALKLAEIQLYFEQYAEYPILLLDDVTSELDVHRNSRLFEYLQQGMQVFMTATSRLEFPELQRLPCTYIELSGCET